MLLFGGEAISTMVWSTFINIVAAASVVLATETTSDLVIVVEVG